MNESSPLNFTQYQHDVIYNYIHNQLIHLSSPLIKAQETLADSVMQSLIAEGMNYSEFSFEVGRIAKRVYSSYHGLTLKQAEQVSRALTQLYMLKKKASK